MDFHTGGFPVGAVSILDIRTYVFVPTMYIHVYIHLLTSKAGPTSRWISTRLVSLRRFVHTYVRVSTYHNTGSLEVHTYVRTTILVVWRCIHVRRPAVVSLVVQTMR